MIERDEIECNGQAIAAANRIARLESERANHNPDSKKYGEISFNLEELDYQIRAWMERHDYGPPVAPNLGPGWPAR